MPSKLVTDYAKTAGTLIVALRAHAKEAGEGVGANLTAMIGPDERVPDVAFLAELLARRVEHDRAELERAEQHTGGDAAPNDPRHARDAAAHELHATLLALRRTTSALFGAAWVQKLGLPAVIHEDSVHELLRAGRDMNKALRDRALPKPTIEGLKSVDPKPWQKRLKQAVKDLEEAVAAMGDAGHQLDPANVAKAKAVVAFERSFSAASMVAVGLLTLAGRDADAHALPREPRKVGKKAEPPPPAAADAVSSTPPSGEEPSS